MVNFPLTSAEAVVVRWTGRALTVIAVGMMVLLGTIALAGS
jgi:hypothetical protein